jgi:centrosomal protein CEP104
MYSSVGNPGIPNLEEELSIDKSTMETLKALYAAKERAVQLEEFDEAKRLKETIDRLKMMSGHIS